MNAVTGKKLSGNKKPGDTGGWEEAVREDIVLEKSSKEKAIRADITREKPGKEESSREEAAREKSAKEGSVKESADRGKTAEASAGAGRKKEAAKSAGAFKADSDMEKNPNEEPYQDTSWDHFKNHKFIANRKYFIISIYALGVITIGAVIFYAVQNWVSVKAGIARFLAAVAPFIAAFFIAYFLNPMVKKVEAFLQGKIFHEKFGKFRKALSVLLSYLFVFSMLGLLIVYIAPQLADSIRELTDKIPSMYGKIKELLEKVNQMFPDVLDMDDIMGKVKDFLPQIASYGTNLVSNVFPMLYQLSVGIVRVVLNTLLAVIISIYMLSDKPLLIKNIKRCVFSIVPRKRASRFWQTAKECNTIFGNFVIGKMIDSLIIGIICFIGMSIFRFPYPLLMSVIVCVTNMIPYFGPIIGAIPGVLIYLLVDPLLALFFAIFILVLQQFDGIYLGPKILGQSTGIRPIWVIFGITVGGAYFGFFGMFLGVPIVAVLSYLLDKWLKRRLTEKHIKEEEL